MTNSQTAKLNSYQRVQSFNETYAADLSTIDDYTDLQKSFNDATTAIEKAAQQQQTTPGVIPDLLKTLKNNMPETTIEFAGRGVVKAQLAGNDELANQLNEPVSFIFYADKNVSVQRASGLRNLMNDNLATLTNIDAADIAAIDAAIEAYRDKMNLPVIAIERKKSKGTGLLAGYFGVADQALDNMFRLVKSYFFRTQPEMVSEMALAMQIINTGIRHTTVELTLLNAADDTPAINATVLDNTNGKIYASDFNGLVHIEQHKTGHATFTISAAGLSSVTVSMGIKRGTTNALTVKLGGK